MWKLYCSKYELIGKAGRSEEHTGSMSQDTLPRQAVICTPQERKVIVENCGRAFEAGTGRERASEEEKKTYFDWHIFFVSSFTGHGPRSLIGVRNELCHCLGQTKRLISSVNYSVLGPVKRCLDGNHFSK